MASEPQKYEDDDGRVICSMDVEGMPWYNRRKRRGAQPSETAAPRGEQMTRSETQRFIWNAVLAALTIVGVFAATWVVFILFLLNVWAR